MDWNFIFTTIILGVLAAATPVVIAQIFRFFQSQINKNKTLANTELDDQLLKMAEQVVIGITEPLAKEYKEFSEKKLTKEQQKEIYEKAKENLVSGLKEQGKKAGEVALKLAIEYAVKKFTK